MRWLIVILLLVWTGLTFLAYGVVRPDRRADDEVIRAFMEVGDDPPASLVELFASFRAASPVELPERLADVPSLPDERRRGIYDAFRRHHDARRDVPLAETPVLIWSTDDNAARDLQCRLFRVWHLRTYGEPVDIRPDPANRDITKVVIQCVAGKGPDLIESYGPSQIRQMVGAGVALDVTDAAREGGFGLDRIFDAAIPSASVPDAEGRPRQYAFPCNVGYTVLFYHADLFAAAGVEPPSGPWTIDDAIARAQRLLEHARGEGIQRRVGIMNLGAWDMALAAGGRFFDDAGTASIYASPETIAGLTAFQDMMYVHRVSPTPAEAASMASGGGANMNATAESASASSLFAAKVTAMYVGGRWEYVSLARRNRDRVLLPAIERALADDALDASRREPLVRAASSLERDVLRELGDAEREAIAAILTVDDRARLVQLGVAHVPTVTGTPLYVAGARVAVVNRSSRHVEHATRFLRFLATETYNEHINQTFDSICGVPEFCTDEDGIAGPPRPLPGLEAMDSPVFAEAMLEHARAEQLSPFIGRGRLGDLATPVIERLQNRDVGPAEAARLIEKRINDQIADNLRRDDALRRRWESLTGIAFDPRSDLSVREQIEAAGEGR